MEIPQIWLKGNLMTEILTIKDQVPVICYDCDMVYYRKSSKDKPCDFCNGSDIHETSEEHAMRIVREALLGDKNNIMQW